MRLTAAHREEGGLVTPLSVLREAAVCSACTEHCQHEHSQVV